MKSKTTCRIVRVSAAVFFFVNEYAIGVKRRDPQGARSLGGLRFFTVSFGFSAFQTLPARPSDVR